MLRPRSIQARVLLAVVLTGTVPLVLAGAFLVSHGQEVAATQASRELSGLAQGVAAELEVVVEARLAESRAIASLPEIRAGDPATRQQTLETLYVPLSAFADLAISSPDGIRIAAARPDPAIDAAQAELAREVGASGRQIWSIARAGPTPRLVVGTAVRDDSGRVVAVLTSALDVVNLLPPDADGRVFQGRAVVLDPDGAVLLETGNPSSAPADRYAAVFAAARAAAGTGWTDYEATDGERRVAGFARVQSLGWTVAVERPERAILETTRPALFAAGVALAASVTLALVAAVVLVGLLTKPLRSLAAAARAFGQGDATAPLPPAGRADRELGVVIAAFDEMRTRVGESLAEERAARAEIGAILEGAPTGLLLVDASGTIRTANPAAARLLGRPADELPGAAVGDVVPDPAVVAMVGGPDGPASPGSLLMGLEHPRRLLHVHVTGLSEDPTRPTRVVVLEDLTELDTIRLRHRAERLLRTTSEAILEHADEGDLFGRLVEAITVEMRFDGGVIALWPPADGGPAQAWTVGWPTSAPHDAASTPRPDETRVLVGAPLAAAWPGADEFSLAVLVPIRAGGVPLGTLALLRRADAPPPSTDVQLLESIAAQIGVAAEKARVDAALGAREAEARLLSLVAARTDNAVIIADRDGRIEWVNDGFTRITGYVLDEVRGRTPGEVLQGPDTDPATVALMRQRLQAGQGFTADVLNYHKSGRPYWIAIEVQPVLEADGRVGRFIGLERDITERREAEARLRDREAMLASIIESSPDVITILDRAGGIVRANAALDEAIGGLPDDASGRGLIGRLHPHDRRAVLRAFRAWLTVPGWDEPVRFRLRHADGSWVTLESRSRQIDGPDGAPRLVVVSRDVTARVAMEDALRRAVTAAETANRAKSELLSRMSHELRTPLNAVLGFAQLLRMDALAAEQAESVDQILRAGNHLLGLVNEVLDLARIEAGRVRIATHPVALEPVLGAVVELARPLADGTVRVVVEAPAVPGLAVLADEQRLRQVLINLVSNGIKYNRPGGRVTIAVAADAERVRIRVVDTGPGIPASRLSRLFTPFDRLDLEGTATEGSGLGLALSRRLVELMAGAIGVESREGVGSSFWVELPRAVGAGDDVRGVAPAFGEPWTPDVLPDRHSDHQPGSLHS